MRFDVPIDDVFRNRSNVQVLRALHRLPEGLPASGREIARRAGISHPTAIRALGVLVEAGLVTAGRSRAGDAYERNHHHLFADQIAELYRTESGIRRTAASFVRDELLAHTEKVEWATLFGSVAWGESTPTSDIDLAVTCAPRHVDEVERALEDLSAATQRRFGNQVNPLISTRKQRPKTGVWKQLEKIGIPLIRSGKAISL